MKVTDFKSFIAYCNKHIKGDEKGEAQLFLDHFFNALGYPDGLKGEAIPLEARILAIADAFSAMSSDRSYASALSLEEILEEIRRGAGKQFDPRLVEVFLPILRNSVIQPLRRT